MVGGRWVRGGAWLLAFACVSCGASNQQRACALPPTTAPQGTLSVTQKNEFGSDYTVLSVKYLLDHCIIQHIEEPVLLRNQTMIAEPRKVTAGRHQFRSEITVRKPFESGLVYGWTMPVEVIPGGTNQITVRVYEDERAPNGTIRVLLQQERSKNPPEEVSRSP